MNSNSRTYNSLRNSIFALGIFAINLILQFFSRKVFLEHLGTEVLGLNTTAGSMLDFLNLAELGVGVTISYALYKPLAEKDYETINEIISVQAWLYKRIAMTILFGAIIIMAFFPLIFKNMPLPLWYAYASFGVLLFSLLITYVFNYKQIILSANQEEYKIQSSFRIILLLKIVTQIICVTSFSNGYIWWLLLEFVFAVFASVVLNIVIKRSHPYLQVSNVNRKILREKYQIIITKVKQFFFHKIAWFVMTQTSSLIIYGYATLSLVAIYGNYMLIVNGITSLLNAIFNGMMASVGNLVSEASEEHIMNVFRELFTSRFFIISTLTFAIYMLSGPFIVHWIGAEYKLSNVTHALIAFSFYLIAQRIVIDSFINAYGLFKDIWAPIIEALLNITLSVTLCYFYGLNGILLGSIISMFLMVKIWKPYFLFTNKFTYPISWYVKLYGKLIFIFIASFIFTNSILYILNIDPEEALMSFIIYSVISVGVFSLSLFSMLYVFESSMRVFVKRFIK